MTKEQLFEEHKNIVYYCYRRLYRDEFVEKSKEDLIQEGFLVLWKACSSHNEQLGIKLSTYAFAAIQNAMFNWIRKNKSYYYNYVSFDEPVKGLKDENITIQETIPDYDLLDSVVSTIDDIIYKYKQWLIKTRNKTNIQYINMRLYRANILLNELVTKEKVTARYIEEEYSINQGITNRIFKELRECLKDTYPTRFNNGGNN